jgi:hypothetical protein
MHFFEDRAWLAANHDKRLRWLVLVCVTMDWSRNRNKQVISGRSARLAMERK